jgi:ubiquinone/menaquinone biosynthesis C-methylase UbiE
MAMKFWDKRAKKYDDLVRKHEADFQKTTASAKSLLSAADVVLDLGCASGEYSLDLATYVRHVHGIDTSATMIALATRKAGDRSIGNATFAVVDVFDRSLAARGITVALAFNVLHLVEDIRPVLGRIHELLPAGGLFVSQTPCFAEIGFLLKSLISAAQKVKAIPRILNFSARELEAEIVRAGFDIARSVAWERKKAIRWIVARKR